MRFRAAVILSNYSATLAGGIDSPTPLAVGGDVQSPRRRTRAQCPAQEAVPVGPGAVAARAARAFDKRHVGRARRDRASGAQGKSNLRIMLNKLIFNALYLKIKGTRNIFFGLWYETLCG